MSPVVPFFRDIKIRGYELDRYNRLSLSNLMRQTEHVRWEAMDKPHFNLEHIFKNGAALPVRAQYIQWHTLAKARQTLRYSMHLSAMGRSSLTMYHRVNCLDTEALVAEVWVVGVHVNRDFQVQPIPEAVRTYVENDLPEPCSLRPMPVPKADTFELTLRDHDIDILQHVNHARYADFVLDAYSQWCQNKETGPWLPQSMPSQFAIEYMREVKREQSLQGHLGMGEDQSLHYAALSSGAEQTPYFTAAMGLPMQV